MGPLKNTYDFLCGSSIETIALNCLVFEKIAFRATLCISAVYAVMRCLSVRLSVTFVDHVKTNKHIFEIFSQPGSYTILVFPYQTGWRYSDGNPPNGRVECRWGIGRNRDSKLLFRISEIFMSDIQNNYCGYQKLCQKSFI